MIGEVEFDGLAELIAANRHLGPDLEAKVRAKVREVAAEELNRLRGAARASSPQASAVSGSLKILAGSDPAIGVSGGSAGVSGGASVAQLAPGSEFGGRGRPTTQQFRPFRGSGYWFGPTIEADERGLQDRIAEALDEVIADWGRDG